MSSQVFELAILLSLKDSASAGADRVTDHLRSMGAAGRVTLKTFDDLRKDMRQGLVLAGAGVAGLAMLKRGVDEAANFESALLDLRSAFQEVGQDGAVSLAAIGDQMNRAERLGIDLGNKLQGTTKDYLEIFSSLKKAGVDVETILGGAGAAAGKLANVSGAITNGSFKEQAKELGQFGKMFKLKPDEFEASVNLFSALRDRFDIESGSLIESSKYFLATASTLGMRGMSGASDTVKLFALLKREAGLEGSQAGTSLTSLFTMFVSHKDQLKKLGQQTGVKFELFDKKGQFLGWENMFKQAEQLQKLPAEKRMVILNKAFGEQGAKAFNAFVEAGVEGWRNVTAEAAKAVPVNDKINAQMETYSAKMEAVMGSIENLKATAFTPMLGTLKPVLDLTNNTVGSLQGFAKANPTIASVSTHIFGIGSAALVATGAVKAGVAALKLWQISRAVSSGQASLLDVLTGNMPRAESSWRSKGVVLGKTLLTGFAIGAPLYAFERYMEGFSAGEAAKQRAFEAGERLGEMIRDGMKKQIEGKLSDIAIKELRGVKAEEEAEPRVEKLGLNESASKTGFFGKASEINTLLAMAMGQKYYREHGYQNQLLNTTGLWYTGTKKDEGAATEKIRDILYAESFAYPEQLSKFLQKAKVALQRAGDPETFPLFKQLAEDVYPQWKEQIESGDGSMQRLTSASDAATTSLFRLSTINPPLFPMFNPNRQYPSETGGILNRRRSEFHFEKIYPSKASGGTVERGGFVKVHSGEDIVPARVTSRYKERASGASASNSGGHHTYNITVNVPSGSSAANDPRHLASLVAVEVRKQRERR